MGKIVFDGGDVLVRDDKLFFWGGWPSQWTIADFVIDSVTYNCCEQWMHAEKARLFGDDEVLGKILASPHPRAQKEFGRKVCGYDDARWVEKRYEVVVQGNVAKYSQNPELLKLLHEAPAMIVEASPDDDVWGIGLGMNEPDIFDPSKWRGQNLLGKAIMEARRRVSVWGVWAEPMKADGQPWSAHWVVTEPLTEKEAKQVAELWMTKSTSSLTYMAKLLPHPPPKPVLLRDGNGNGA